MNLWTTLVLVIAFAAPALAHRIELAASSKQCFYEVLNPEDRITVTYEVGGASGGGGLEIDFWVTDPTGNTIFRNDRKAQGSFSAAAVSHGRYTYCFGNEFTSYHGKTVSFHTHGLRYGGEDERMQPIEQEIRNLASSLQLVKDEQAYLVVRERTHRNTCESTNARVKWWAFAQIAILLSVCGWNVHYLKSWFEVKRVL